MRYSLLFAAALAVGCGPTAELTVTMVSSPLLEEQPFAGVTTLELRWTRPGQIHIIEQRPFTEDAILHLTPPVLVDGTQLEVAALGPSGVVSVGRSVPLAKTAKTALLYFGLVNQFSVTPLARPLESARFGASATVLGDGRVLLAGGATRGAPGLPDPSSISAQLDAYDPATGGFARVTSGAFGARIYHAAVPTRDGGVLYAGGLGPFGALDDLVRFSGSGGADSLASAGKLPGPRYGAAVALLPDGRALLVGGYSAPDGMGGGTLAPDAVLLDGDGNATTIALPSPRAFAAATTLADGSVLVSGGSDAMGPRSDALLFSPASGSFSPLAPSSGRAEMLSPRVGHSATLLPSGGVFLFGGNDGRASVAAAEFWSPDSGGFVDPPIFNLPTRQSHSGVALDDGSVLLVGGESTPQPMTVPSPVHDLLHFSPNSSNPGALGGTAGITGVFSDDLPPSPARAEASVTRLGDGSLLYVGGAVGNPRTLAGGAQLFVPCFGDCLAFTP